MSVRISVAGTLLGAVCFLVGAALLFPAWRTAFTPRAKASFLAGADWAFTAGIIAILVGAVIVFYLFPNKHRELQLLDQDHAEDTTGSAPDKAARA